MARIAFFIGLFVGLLVLAAPVSAQPGRDRSSREQRLFFGTLSLGIGDCGGIWCGPAEGGTGPHFGTGAGVYVRPIPYFAAGIDLHLNWMGAEHEADNRHDEGASYRLGNIALRGIIPLGQVEPWAGVGFGLAGWSYGWLKDDKEEDRSVTGTNVALSAGADIHLTDRFWLGGMLRFAFPSWSDHCKDEIDRDGDRKLDCEPVASLDLEDQEELPTSLWFVGITGRVDF